MHMYFAYIDPGVGLLAWQALVAAVLGLVFYLRKTRNWLMGLAVKMFRRNKMGAGVSAKAHVPVDSHGR